MKSAFNFLFFSRAWHQAPFVLLLFVGALVAFDTAQANTCTQEDFDKAIDQAAKNIRQYNSTAAPIFSQKLRAYKIHKGWGEQTPDVRALDALHDKRVAELDSRANDLVSTIDTLGIAVEGEQPKCDQLPTLNKAGRDLLKVMTEKSVYLTKKIDLLTKAKTEIDQARKSAPKKTDSASQNEGRHSDSNSRSKSEAQHTPKASPEMRVQNNASNENDIGTWKTNTSKEPMASQSPATDVAARQNTQDNIVTPPNDYPGSQAQPPQIPGFAPNREQGYTIDEIRSATRGFFGNVSTGLASVIEHAFRNWGHPTGYVLGQEGGGAFLAGLRYGKGTLYLRNGQQQPIYWHGPSVGYDFGATGSRTMFLIYNLETSDGLYRRFTGIDGSAYLIGGVGLTILKGGPVVMAPIRSGLGLRIGANIGYLRFTRRPTWNPF